MSILLSQSEKFTCSVKSLYNKPLYDIDLDITSWIFLPFGSWGQGPVEFGEIDQTIRIGKTGFSKTRFELKIP